MDNKLERLKLFFFGKPEPLPPVVAKKAIVVEDISIARAFVQQHGLNRFIATRYKSIELIRNTLDLTRLFLNIPAEFHIAIVAIPSIRAILESAEVVSDLCEVLRATPAAYCAIMSIDAVNKKLYQERFLKTFVLDHYKTTIIFKKPFKFYPTTAFCFAQMLQYDFRCQDSIPLTFANRDDTIFHYYHIAAQHDFLPAREFLSEFLLRQANIAITALKVDEAIAHLLKIPQTAREYGEAQFLLGEIFFIEHDVKRALGHLLSAHLLGIVQATRLLNQGLNTYYQNNYRGTLDQTTSEELIKQFTAEKRAAQIEELDLQFEPTDILRA